jgi:Fe-S cluster assembly ATP-binding protein
MLEIKNLHVSVGEREILKGLTLTVKDGEVAAIMGPNGTGKSTLSYVIAGREGYDVTQGEVLLNGENILDLDPHERAARGLFLAFQYPVEIPGVATMQFLKATLNAQRRSRGEPELQTPDLMKRVRDAAAKLCGVRSIPDFPAAKKSAWKFFRWLCWSRPSAFSTKPTLVSTSTPCASSRKA